VLLLHYLATGETTAPDFALALAKVLCGLPPHAPHDALEPVTAVESAEAMQLLDAVIAHAGCFGDISPDGLRGSFLMRDGILSTRDGAWLLRVERLTADAVLARLPWTTEWIRQPWMQAAMRVEW
jgi:Contractile injection system tape measure protein